MMLSARLKTNLSDQIQIVSSGIYSQKAEFIHKNFANIVANQIYGIRKVIRKYTRMKINKCNKKI